MDSALQGKESRRVQYGTILRGHDKPKKELHSVTHLYGHPLDFVACNSASLIATLVVTRRGYSTEMDRVQCPKHIHVSFFGSFELTQTCYNRI